MGRPGGWIDVETGVPRILVVDDEAAVRLVLRDTFEDAGFLVEEASSGEQALHKVPAFEPDLVLLDVMMPGMDGFETCARIHEQGGFEELPVLMMTGLEDVGCFERAYDSGAADVVSKPLNGVSLIRRVSQLTEAAHMRRRLQQAETNQQALVNAVDAVLVRLNKDGRIHEVRAGDEFAHHLDTTSWTGHRIQDVISPEAAARLLAVVEEALSSGRSVGTVQGLCPDGGHRDCEVAAVAKGAREVTVVIRRTGTPSAKRSQGAVFFRSLADALPDPIFVLSHAGKIEYENPAASKELLDGRGHMGIGRGLGFVHPEDAGVVFNGIVDTLKSNGKASRFEFRVRDRRGFWRIWDGRIVNLFMEPAIGGLLLACRDITELKEKESELLRQRSKAQAMEQFKSEYLAVVSHELRTPLNTILGHTELMLDDMLGTLTQEQLVSLRRIRKNAREVLDLTFSILDLTRIDAGSLPLEYEKVSVPEVLQEIRDDTELIQRTDNVELIWHVDSNLEELLTDRAKFKIVVRNLIANAIKFTPRGRVAVDARSCDGHLEVRVTDTGIGIPDDKRELIFEPFGSVEGHTCCNEGAGLGLYIVKRFVGVLGGDINVESAPGEGTSFTVSFVASN